MMIVDKFNVSPLFIGVKTASLSLDLEYDYGGENAEALKRFEDLVYWLAVRKIDLTVFVEGRVLRQQPGIRDLLNQPHIYPAQHCFDHRKSKDARSDIERGRDLFIEKLGRHPKGYRAHTFQHSGALIKDLMDLGFEWDSSYLPSWLGYGAKKDKCLGHILKSGADAIRYQDIESGNVLIELPVGTLQCFNVPFIHSYQLLIGKIISGSLQRLFSIQHLHIHDTHMVDLYKATNSLSNGAVPWLAKLFYLLSWRGKNNNSLALLGAFIDRCESMGWSWCSIESVNRQLSSSDEH